jgi:hypothetical protein
MIRHKQSDEILVEFKYLLGAAITLMTRSIAMILQTDDVSVFRYVRQNSKTRMSGEPRLAAPRIRALTSTPEEKTTAQGPITTGRDTITRSCRDLSARTRFDLLPVTLTFIATSRIIRYCI